MSLAFLKFMKLRFSESSAHFHMIFLLSINERLLTNQQHLIYSFICLHFINECDMLLYCQLYSFRSFFMIRDLFFEDFQKNLRIQLLINVIFLVLFLHHLLQFLSVEINIFNHNLDVIINDLVTVS